MLILNNSCNAQLILRFQSQINTHASKLGDVLQMENANPHWADLPLQSTPLAGERITQDRLIKWMTQQLGEFSWEWQGKTQIQVQQVVESTADALMDKAKTALIKMLEPHYTRIDIQAISELKDSEYNQEEFKTEIRLTFPTNQRVCVWLIHKHQRIAVWFTVKSYAKVLIASHDLTADSAVQKETFTWHERNIAGLNALPVSSFPKNRVLKSAISTGGILLESHLKEPPPIARGQRIKVTVRDHGVTLIMDAIALTEGYIGQKVTVKNPATSKSIIARVSGRQQAEVSS